MRALEVIAPNELRLVEKPIPEPGPGQVRVRVHWAGVCGTDFSLIAGKLTFAQYPVVPGHEFSGRVSAVGSGVDLPIGQLVTINPILSCQKCEACLRGEINHCSETAVLGVAGTPGGFADEVLVPAYTIRPLPDHLSMQAGAVAEPTAVAVRVARSAGIKEGDRVAVLGAGSIGLLVLQVAFAFGASCVSITDPIASRMQVALSLDGTQLNPDQESGEYDVIIDGVGAVETLHRAVRLARRGGRVAVYGVPHPARMELSVQEIFSKDVSLAFTRLYPADWSEAFVLLADNRVDWNAIVTHEVALEELPATIASVMADPATGIKIHTRIADMAEE